MSVNEIRDFQKCYKWIGFSKENSYYIKWNAWNPCNSIDHLQEKNNKLVITEHQKSSHKLSKTEKLYNSSLYSDAKKIKTFLNEKKIKITKREHAFKGYASICNVKILNSFNPELHPKDTESAIKKKLKK